MAPSLSLRALTKVWPNGTRALEPVSLDVAGGDDPEFVAILGGSGAGKSTLLRCIARLVEPTSGQVLLDGTDMSAATGRALSEARARVGFVFQQFNLVPRYTALENVLLARVPRRTYWQGILGRFSDEDRAIAARSLEQVGLADKLDAPARELSGGQQQRVAVARAFAQEPRLLLADEPTASLDPRLADVVLDLLRAYGREHRVPVLVNVHTVDHARRFATRILGLREGKLVFDGPSSSLAGDAEAVLEKIYGASAVTNVVQPRAK
ncbi:MAG: phosphonate ABC transporter ATP-binding protein [Myxococcales bacterium]|nr:phosphonate ABC transporter ATP-binding protein [Myxococcales bacterium]